MGKSLVLRLAAVAAGGTIALAIAGPALAQTTVDLNGDHRDTTAAEFATHECDGPFENLADDQDGWHFVLTQFTGDADDVEFVLQFEDTEGDPVEETENATNVTGSVAHLFLVTPAGWTLLDGEAVVSPPGSLGENPQFNLSHTCPGVPGSPSPSPSPSESPSPSPGDESPSAAPTASPGNGEGGGLPTTGVQVGGLATLGAVLLAGGAAMVFGVRRRRGLADTIEG